MFIMIIKNKKSKLLPPGLVRCLNMFTEIAQSKNRLVKAFNDIRVLQSDTMSYISEKLNFTANLTFPL